MATFDPKKMEDYLAYFRNQRLGSELFYRCGPVLQLQLCLGLFGDRPVRIGNRAVWVDHKFVEIELFHLEEQTRATRTKPAKEWKNGPLKGLWRKHWSQAEDMPRNILNELEKLSGDHSLLRYVAREYPDKKIGEYLNENDAEPLAKALTTGLYEKRLGKKENPKPRLTGEWIVYEPTSDGNIYWTLAAHDEKHEDIKSRCQWLSSLEITL